MAKKSRFDYFESFTSIGEHAVKAAHLLRDSYRDFDPANLRELLPLMHEIENASDNITHEIYTNVVTEFITPIDREDVLSLTQELDTVVDRVEAALQYTFMLNIQAIPGQAVELADVLAKSTEALHEALKDFSNFKKSKVIRANLVEVNTLEEVGDRIYLEAYRELYTSDLPAVQVIADGKLYDRLERALDSCEHAANVVETTIMKNS